MLQEILGGLHVRGKLARMVIDEVMISITTPCVILFIVLKIYSSLPSFLWMNYCVGEAIIVPCILTC